MNASLLRQKPLLWLVLLLAWFVLVVQPVAEKVASGNFFASDGFASGATSESPGLPGLEGIGPENRVGFHETYKYSNSGLGVGAQLAIAIVVTYLTAGAASAAIGTAAGATAGSGTAMAAGTAATATTAATSAGWANIALTAVATTAASQTAISTINNQGDLGAVFKDVTSSDALKNYAAAGISAGYSPENMGLQLSVNAALKTVTQGGSFTDNLGQAAVGMIADAVSKAIYNQVGDALIDTGLPTKVAVHAMVGGLMAEAAGGDFRTGALAAGANEALVAAFGKEIFPGEQHEKLLGMTSNLIGMTVAAAAGGDEKAQEKAGWVAQQATLNNYLFHEEMEEMTNKIKACGGDQGCEQPIRDHYADLDEQRNKEFPELCRTNLTACVQIADRLSAEDKLNVALMESLRNAQYNGLATAIGTSFIAGNRVTEDQATLEYVRQTGGTAEEFKAVLAMLGTGVAGVGPKTVEKATKALDRLKALQLSKGESVERSPYSSIVSPDAEAGMPYTHPVKGATAKQIFNNSDDLQEVSISVTPLEGQRRLNTLDTAGNGKLNPAEAAAAARLETVLGKMERTVAGLSGKNADFVIASGPNSGKTVDLMYTTKNLNQKEIDGINSFFEKNMTIAKAPGKLPDGQQQILDHLNKADIVPVDFSVLVPKNQKIFTDYIKTLPKALQDKVIIMR